MQILWRRRCSRVVDLKLPISLLCVKTVDNCDGSSYDTSKGSTLLHDGVLKCYKACLFLPCIVHLPLSILLVVRQASMICSRRFSDTVPLISFVQIDWAEQTAEEDITGTEYDQNLSSKETVVLRRWRFGIKQLDKGHISTAKRE